MVNSSSRNKAKHDGGNDLRPDPLKLLHIGSRISGMEEMFKSKDVKNSGKQRKATGREKNILASRICRLRKKAQHEANKIKLEGLQKEQSKCSLLKSDWVIKSLATFNGCIKVVKGVRKLGFQGIYDERPVHFHLAFLCFLPVLYKMLCLHIYTILTGHFRVSDCSKIGDSFKAHANEFLFLSFHVTCIMI